MSDEHIYVYPELLHLLQINFTVQEYQDAVEERKREVKRKFAEGFSGHAANIITTYTELLPRYLYARCPICGVECLERFDNYTYEESLYSHYPPARMTYSYNRWWTEVEQPCSHYVGIDNVVNTHGELPPDITERIRFGFDVPSIAGHLMPESLNARVVLHAMPVCRIEGNEFVPSYTRFIVTYFNDDPQQLLDDVFELQIIEMRNDSEYHPGSVVSASSRLARRQERLWDLQQLATDGELGYLDFTRPDLPLVIGKGTQLPSVYHDIKGFRYLVDNTRLNRFIWGLKRKLGMM